MSTGDGTQAVPPGGAEPHEGHTDCSEVLHRIFEYLDGEMGPMDVARVAAHLQECGPCLAEHDLERTLKAVIRRSCAQESAPMTLRMSIMQSITVVRFDDRG
ncbi:MAG TPA: mycothiol system anti-sigma-R factor [Phycicoccus sp.]|jgi:mycothiol system anti-sigma-R factor|nr:mycothiol system anti-sigma-R factor [Phycicoccus sp.]HQH06361.1 mycothiol system anti-sigma-R factor [Phycicoccus sp.]HQK30773.1 mycothiol system anti-sigma-R factor [Phycicoccus sp.]HQY96051.1 mycothiol system anti-sigma-R factor [Phycicoccus sp.]